MLCGRLHIGWDLFTENPELTKVSGQESKLSQGTHLSAWPVVDLRCWSEVQ